MCGIAGIFNSSSEPIKYEFMKKLLSGVAHRGKDYEGIILGATDSSSPAYSGVALGHRRLSIVDLHVSASQPMKAQKNKCWIVFNGEIYNYKNLRQELLSKGRSFNTNSDTEVILEAYAEWGVDCLSKLNGMFSFAIWDDEKEILFCARDPVGIKPFYYSFVKGTFIFCSESQAINRLDPRPLDEYSLFSYLIGMYVIGENSIFQGIKKLLPGHYLIIRSSGDLEISKYWTVNTLIEGIFSKPTLSTLEEVIRESVALQVTSEVPIGALLSGGVDSGLIVSYAAESCTSLHTYSAGFNDPLQLNELPIARRLASRYRTIHHEKIIVTSEIPGILESAISASSEPVADSAIVPSYALSEMAARDGIKILLSGSGGDEIFGGYRRYVGDSIQRKILLNAPWILRTLGSKIFSKNIKLSSRLRSASLDMLLCTGGSFELAYAFISDEKKFCSYLERLIVEISQQSKGRGGGLYNHMAFDLRFYLPDELLLLLDQVTMASTVEGRVPLLDTKIIELAYALQPRSHATANQTKAFLNKIARNRLDPETFLIKKQGFSGPVQSWVESHKNKFYERIEFMLADPIFSNLKSSGYISENNKINSRQRSNEIYSLYTLSIWMDSHVK
jgi:asparagine synthase (glutamine-hydrolysing)